jgi:uncharacterized protein (TIGR00297 family)
VTRSELAWQSKLILLLVVPAAACDVVFKTGSWASRQPAVAIWVLGLSGLLALITWRLRSATPAGSATGGILTASLMYSTVGLPPVPWHTALIPVLAVALLASVSTRLGREKKECLGAAERREGRSAAQVAANLGIAALVSSEFAQAWASDHGWFAHVSIVEPLIVAGLAALAEAAADTVSSEIGQILGGRPRMLTTLRAVDPGTDGAISVAGTLAGIVAAAIVAALGTAALAGGTRMFAVSCAGGVFGLFFDSLLGATIERSGWLNNDAVNFLSTASAASFAIFLLGFLH